MFATFVHEPAKRMFLLSMKLARFSLMRVQVFVLEIGTRLQVWIQMRGNSFNIFTGHLGEFGKAKTVSLSAGIQSFQIRKK